MASLTKRARRGFIACRGAMAPRESHQSAANAAAKAGPRLELTARCATWGPIYNRYDVVVMENQQHLMNVSS